MYGATISGITKLAIYFGTNLSRTSFMHIVKQKSNYDDVLMKCKASLQDEKIGIAIFDNTQKSTNIFYQRKGKWGEYNVVTSRMFLKAYIPPILDTIYNQISHSIKITYLNQLIPAPINFQNFVHHNVTKYLFDPATAIIGDEINVDPIRHYVKMIDILRTISNMRHWMADGRKTKIKNTIKQGLKDKSFMKSFFLFQVETMERWRGVRPTAQALFLPVSGEDDLTQNGASKVVLGLMSIFGLLQYSVTDEEEEKISNISLRENF